MTDLNSVLAAFEQTLTLEAELGTRMIDIDRALLVPPRPAPVRTPAPAAKPVDVVRSSSVVSEKTPAAKSVDVEQYVPGIVKKEPPAAVSAATLEEIAKGIAACSACGLSAGRTHVVPGEGLAERPDFMFIGEAPGAEEDREGRPFVGAAGRFLTKMIAAAGYTRENVFIANICKCRPPGNRTPSPSEMTACIPFLKRQIALVRPRVIILLGRTAMSGLFPETRILRNVWYEYEGIPVIATFHPAYILRFDPVSNAAGLRTAKLEVWNVLKAALLKIGRTPPVPKRKG